MTAGEVASYIGFAGSIVCGFCCGIIAVINAFRTISNRKAGVPLTEHWWQSPFNIVFSPSKLTKRGLSARRWFFYGIFGFFACYVFAAVIGKTTGVAN
jgi:hypothetical protein